MNKIIDARRDADSAHKSAQRDVTKARTGEKPNLLWSELDEYERALVVQALEHREARLAKRLTAIEKAEEGVRTIIEQVVRDLGL